MRKKLFINTIISLIISSFITASLAFYLIEQNYVNSKEEKLYSNILLIKSTLLENYESEGEINYFQIVSKISKDIGSRVTLIEDSGRGIADSKNNSIIFSDQSGREEFKNGIRNNVSLVKRYSKEAGEKYFYLTSSPIKIGDENIIIRLGEDYKESDYMRDSFLAYVLFSIVMGIISALFISYLSIGNFIKPIKALTIASKDIAQGNFSKRVWVNKDDEIGELALTFNNMAAELENLEDMRKDFVANVSHELRTPLTSISGFIETLKTKDLSDENKKKALDIIDIEVERLKNLINELLTLSRIENTIVVKEKGEMDIENILYSVIELLETQRREKKIVIKTNIEKDIPNPIGDKDLLKLVFINLIENSIKYGRYEGFIKVDINKYHSSIKIEISDNGIGISEQDTDKIFESFYRAEKSRLNSDKSTGLGLSIVKNIVNLLHGTISVESKLDLGTKFTVKLK